MSDMPLRECFQTLGLSPAAPRQAVQESFRRLAKAHHPDVRRNSAGNRAFIRIVRAYKTIQGLLWRERATEEKRLCPSCGRIVVLLDALDGRPACSDCLLGLTRRRYLLPLPSFKTVKHAAVIALEILSAFLFLRALDSGGTAHLLASLSASTLALVILAATCIRIRYVS